MTFLLKIASLASLIVLMIHGLSWMFKTVQSLLQRKVVAKRVSREETELSTKHKYQIRFFYDWGCDSPFWCSNDATRAKFDVGPIEPETLGLSIQTSETVRALAKWHDTALNWDYPPDPGPWRQEECDRFNAAVDSLLKTIRAELSEEYEIIDRQGRYYEDPDLDRYLAAPKGFRR